MASFALLQGNQANASFGFKERSSPKLSALMTRLCKRSRLSLRDLAAARGRSAPACYTKMDSLDGDKCAGSRVDGAAKDNPSSGISPTVHKNASLVNINARIEAVGNAYETLAASALSTSMSDVNDLSDDELLKRLDWEKEVAARFAKDLDAIIEQSSILSEELDNWLACLYNESA